jgi:hypothetical protein
MRTRLFEVCRWLAVAAIPVAGWSAPDTLYASHHAGPCSDYKFPTIHVEWSNRGRIELAEGETIHVTLYGHGADLATDATGSDIKEWISSCGTTTNYPNAPIIAGQRVAKGYVTVAIKGEAENALGNRTVTVKWVTGSETIPVRVVAGCAGLAPSDWRREPPAPSNANNGGGNPVRFNPPVITGGTASPAPFLDTAPRAVVGNVFRRTGGPQRINNGTFLPVESRWCANLPSPNSANAASLAQTITLPDLTWGASNVGTGTIGAGFAAQLSTTAGAPLQTANVPGGLQPGATQEFQFRRPASQVRVIRFAIPQPQGCFVNPNDAGFFEDPAFTVQVDTTGVVTESNETNNSRNF